MVMKVDLPGLLCERSRGKVRWRVRVIGQKHKRIAIPPPDHPQFWEHYQAARNGERFEEATKEEAIPESLTWLVERYDAWMSDQVRHGLLNEVTKKQRAAFYKRLTADHGDKSMVMPASKLIEIRDSMAGTPGAADNMVKAVRALYAWACKREIVSSNPASGIEKINKSVGAIPWSVEDLRQFRECHPLGTMAHAALSLFMFTSCRLGDAIHLGPKNERKESGVTWLSWQPEKRGSAPVDVPMLPPLKRALEAQKVVGSTYLLTARGKPFASKNAFGNWFRERVKDAGLENRSPHGIRKASGELMALEGATQYHIMAVHGHTQAKTSEVYTKGVNRKALASSAVDKLASMEW